MAGDTTGGTSGGCLRGIVAFFVVLLLSYWVGGLLGCNVSDNDSKAKAGCRAAVDQQLVSPKSASYRYIRVDTSDEDRWVVAGIVTSKNRFGVGLESSFFCGFDGGIWPADVELTER